MDIRKATAVKNIDGKYALAIFETDWQGLPQNEPSVHFLIRVERKNGTHWWQWTPGWYVSTLLGSETKYTSDEKVPGLYIDYGQDWFIPAGPISLAKDYFKQYLKGDREYDQKLADEIAKESW